MSIVRNSYFSLSEEIKTSRKIVAFVLALLLLVFGTFIYKEIFEQLQRIRGFSPKHSDIDIPTYILFITTVIVYPVIEELVFRLSLRFSPLNIVLSLCLLIAYKYLIRLEVLSLFYYVGSFLIIKILFLVVIGIILYLLLNISAVKNRIEFVWRHYHWIVFSTSIFTFGCVHIDKFNIPDYYVAFVIVTWFGFIGFLLSYVRLKIGIFASIFFHILINVTPILFSYVLSLTNYR